MKFLIRSYRQRLLAFALIIGLLSAAYGCSSSAFIRSNQLLIAQGEVGQAIQNYQTALQTDRENHELYYYLANAYYTVKSYDLAEVEINKAILLEPQLENYRLLAGKIAFSRSNYFDAINHLLNALLLNESNLEGYYYLALSYMKAGEQMKALAQLETAIALEPLYYDAQYLWAKIKFNELETKSRQQVASAPPKSGTELSTSSQSFEKELIDLVSRFSLAMETNPKSIDGSILLAGMYNALGEVGKARMVLSQWLERYGDTSDVILMELALTNYRSSSFEDARNLLTRIAAPTIESRILNLKLLRKLNPGADIGTEAKRLLANNDEVPELLILLGQEELEKGNLIDAEKYFQSCIDKTPNDAGCYFGLSTAMEAQKDDFGHQWALSKAFELAPFDKEIRLSYARRLLDQEEFDQALAALNHPIFAENDPEVAFLKGIIAKEKNDYKKATELLFFAQHYAYSVEIETQFADMELRQGQFQQAEQRLEKIESITPGHWEIALVKAKLYESTRRIELVSSLLTPFITTAEGGGRIHLALANAYARTGNIKKSVEVLEQGIKTWSRHLELIQALTFYLGLTEQYGRAIELLEDLQAFKHKYNELFYHRLRLYYYKAGMMKQFKEYREPISIIH